MPASVDRPETSRKASDGRRPPRSKMPVDGASSSSLAGSLRGGVGQGGCVMGCPVVGFVGIGWDGLGWVGIYWDGLR